MTSRRGFLTGAASAGGALMTVHGRAYADATRHVTDAPASHAADTFERVPFLGRHQAGVVTPRQADCTIACFDTVFSTPAELEQMFRALTERIAFLTTGGTTPALDPRLPPADSGILGPTISPDNLTITVGVGASFFEKHDWLAQLKPNTLQRMVQFPNDALDSELCHGDMSIQFCANTQDTNIHGLRDVVKNLSRFLVMRWMQTGNVPTEIPPADGSRAPSARNFLGFRDGSANHDSTDAALMDELVWVGADEGEPAWAAGGTYQAIRIIRNFVERWDRTPLGEQEAIIGRRKDDGAPLGGTTEYETFDYVDDLEGEVTPLDAHIRMANPRTPNKEDVRMLRRPYNYTNGAEKNGQIDQGLLFVAYQSNLDAGFIAVQNRLNGEPLEEYIKPVGGGYFFVLPGIRDSGDYLGRTLVKATAKVAVTLSD